jgi:hypothetical protein
VPHQPLRDLERDAAARERRPERRPERVEVDDLAGRVGVGVDTFRLDL